MFVYLWILFGLFVLNERIILRQHGIGFTSQGFAIFNALVLAKIMMIAEDLSLSHWLGRWPLIYSILHDSILLTVLFIVFHVIERVVVGVLKGETLANSIPAIGGGGFGDLMYVAVILFVGLIPHLRFRNVSRALGSGRLKALLFGSLMDTLTGSCT